MRISVIIITRNRETLLDRCLFSLANQTLSPQEVLIVDNGSVDHTQQVIANYNKFLPIRSIREPRIGIPYARNAALNIARGDAVAFLDDDCIASPTWLSAVKNCFNGHPSAVGFIGNTSVANNQSAAALVEFAYNRRWVLTHTKNLSAVGKIDSGVVVDFKNAAFRLKFIRQFYFSILAPFGDAGSNEDAELGFRMFQKNQNIFYSPSMKAAHTYSPTISRLLKRNFWGGYGDELLLLQNGIDLNNSYHKPKTQGWPSLCVKISKPLPLRRRVTFYLLLLFYPLASRTGRLLSQIAWKLHVPISIPQR